jgi:hypothetical protein
MTEATPTRHITETEWWNDLMRGVFGPRKGGARIIVDAEDASTGVGKTGLACYIAQLCSRAFGYEMAVDDLTLSGAHYLKRWREHPGREQPSVLVLDEIGGAGAAHSRRSMSTQNVELGNAWQLMRKKRIVSIVTLPHWNKVDKDMRQQADFRLWCKRRPIGHFQPYEVGTGFDDGGVRTVGYDDVIEVKFPNMDAHGNDIYQALSRKKDQLLESDHFDADKLTESGDEKRIDPDEARKEVKQRISQELRGMGHTTREVADAVDMSQSWVVRHTEQAES